jgi:hypothetical protein
MDEHDAWSDVSDDATREVMAILSERSLWRLWAETIRALGVDPGEEPAGLDTTAGTAWKWGRRGEG